ncbi:MAG: membrane protein of unknown function [Promethearchaeota archaeon]|nr:MAG: membrane protein of unknown function [Candidatus Lokiarchaeota archaeon]
MKSKIISQIYIGIYTRKNFKRFVLPISFSIFFILLITSRLIFPGFYSIFSNTISDLGNPILNPFPGWLFFSLAFWSLAVLFPPLFLYLHRRLVVIHQIEAKIGTSSNIISIFGMILLGIFPNLPETNFMHLIAAILSFAGMGVAIIFYWLAVIHDSIQKAMRYHHIGISMILIFITFLFTAITFLGSLQIGSEIFDLNIIWLFDFPFWEWLLFIFLSFQLFFIGIIIPEQFSYEKST